MIETGEPRLVPSPRELTRQLLLRTQALGVPLGALIAVYYAIWSPLPAHHGSRVVGVVGNVAATIVFTIVISALYLRVWGRRFRDRLAWVGNQTPTAVERSWLFGVPRRLATELFGAMVAVAGVMTAANRVAGGVGSWAIIPVGLVLVGLTMAALVYLVDERVLRPVFAQAGRHEDHGTVGVRVRLLTAWAVGSGVPLLFLVAIPLRGSAGVDRLPVTVAMEFMAGYALAVGVVVTVVMAGSVADPLASLRAGLQRVRGGDLAAEVDGRCVERLGRFRPRSRR